MRIKNEIIIKFIFAFIVIIGSLNIFSIKAYCKNTVVVIDPGHGGEALGGNMDDRYERDINLITAKAMKERLEMYDDVEVYLTRDNNEDADLSRKQRFDIAKSKNADFLFSVHYNMSENHTLFGSEVWVASKGINYVKGYTFATIEMEALTSLGLFDRGIKNKLNDAKNGENYGILKYAEEYEIPAVIIEHCHLDEERDSAFWNNESYKLLGQTDADSVAKYFRLSSETLGIDNSNYELIDVEMPDKRLDIDDTAPEYCEIVLDSIDDNNAYITIKSKDSDTYVQYYQYSLDGGVTFSRLEAWEDRNSESQQLTIPRIESDIELVVNVYNQYEFNTFSNIISIPALLISENINKYNDQEIKDIYIDINVKEPKNEISPVFILVITLISLFAIFNILFFISISRRKRKR